MQEFTILVVDDDPAIRRMLNELLTAMGDYKVIVAGDSKEAVNAFYAEPRIDVVLTDIHMPDHTGLEMVADMKTLDFQPEILVMTANGNPENVEKARKIGARSMILKPFDNLDVIETEIRKAVEAAAEKRGEELQDEVTARPSATVPTEESTEKPTPKPNKETSEESTEPAKDEMTPSVPACAIDLPERPTVGEISVPRIARTFAGNRHHVPQETTGPTKDITHPLKADPTPADPTPAATTPAAATPADPTPAATTPVAATEDARTTAEETAPEIPAELQSIFRVSADIDAESLNLQVPIICLQTLEEHGAIDALRRLAGELGRKLYTWSATRGIVDGAGNAPAQANAKPRRLISELWSKLLAWTSIGETVDEAGKVLAQAHLDPLSALEFIARQTHDGMFILADFGRCLEDPRIVRTLREMVMEGHTARAMIVLTAPGMIIPPELESSCEVFDWPASEEQDIEAVFNQARQAMEVAVGRPISLDADARENLLERLKGMSAGRARFEIARTLMKTQS